MMKASFAQSDVSPKQPVKQAGFIQQTEKRFEVRDPLYVQMLGIDDGEKIIILLSADSVGMNRSIQDEIQGSLHFEKPAEVILSCTHTHFAPDSKDPVYRAQFVEQAVDMIRHAQWQEISKPGFTFRSEFYDGLGRSRISGFPSDKILLTSIGLFDGDQQLAEIVVHNCHPTVMDGYTPFFSAEYPGQLKRMLSEAHPGRFCMFLQSCAGDISTRFTRSSQSYEAMCELAEKLYHEVERLDQTDAEIQPVSGITTLSETVAVKHVFEPIDISVLPEGITDREIETIRIGSQVRADLAKRLDTLPAEVTLSCIKAGALRILFCPNELFSSYLNDLVSDTSVLVCYSGGYGGYVTPPGFAAITYERFTDTWSDETKRNIEQVIRKMSE
ncbi:MAG: hypothetical protein Q4D24_04035 [Erysipelotrichaceae bacterium]|nr:hypothetical protein [Erysipelotrichaceae bacterium]